MSWILTPLFILNPNSRQGKKPASARKDFLFQHLKKLTTMEKNENTFVGIDVAKEELVLHILPTNEQLTVPHSTEGIKTLVKRFKKIEPQQIVLEATGKFHRELVAALAANGFAVVVVNPRQARDLAKGLGELTKTDAVVARILARIAQLQCLTVRPITSQETMDMNDLVTRRQQLITMRTQEKNRLQNAKTGRVF